MIHNLFKLRLPETKNDQELLRIQPMEQVSKFRLFVFNVVNFFCKKVSKSLCSKSNINLDRYKKAHKSLKKDLNIINQIRLYREHRYIIKTLLSKNQQDELKEIAQQKTINYDEGSSTENGCHGQKTSSSAASSARRLKQADGSSLNTKNLDLYNQEDEAVMTARSSVNYESK